MTTKVLFVSSSPIKEGSVETFGRKIGEFLISKPGVVVETAGLAN